MHTTHARRHGRNIYVATAGGGGNNANSGLTTALPKLTINGATAIAAAGDNIVIRAGTYTTACVMNVSGTAAKRVTYRAYGGEAVVLDGSGNGAVVELCDVQNPFVTLEGLSIQSSRAHGVQAYNTHHCTILRCTIQHSLAHGVFFGSDSPFTASHDHHVLKSTINDCYRNNAARNVFPWGQGVSLFTSDNSTVEDCVVSQCFGEGIGVLSSVGCKVLRNTVWNCISVLIYPDSASNLTVDSNFCYYTGDTAYLTNPAQGSAIPAGIYMGNEPADPIQIAMANITVTNNIVVACLRGLRYSSADQAGGLQNAIIANNTFTNCTGSNIRIDADASHSGNVLKNNVCYQPSAATNVQNITVTGWTADHNCFFNGVGTPFVGTGDVTTNPSLVSPGTLTAVSYKPQAGSPILNTGTAVAAVVTDFSGVVRSGTLSMGAYQTT